MNIGEVLVRFGADIGGFMGGIRTATGALGTFGAAAVAAGVIVAGLAIAIGVISVKAAADFQQGLNRLVTGAGDTTDNMKAMGQSILGISTATGVLTGQLLPAMYQIISAGQRGAQAQDTLKVAAMGSVTEQAKVVDVAKALTTAMTDYGTSQFNATQFMNGYTRATQLGKLTLEELSTSMGPILPLAKNIGISFADVAGAMSTMTNAGIPAERAATSLRFLFQSLENPTHKATVEMEKMGLSSVAVGNELKKSLPGALEMIYKAALKAGPEGSVPFNRAVSDMIGGQRSLQAYLSLTGTHFATYRGNVRAIADAMNFSKTAVLGWDVAQQNFNTKLSQAHAALDALFITIGSHLLPVLTQIVGAITPILSRFADWVTHTHDIDNAIAAVTPYFNAMFDIIKAALPVVIGLFLQFIAILGQATRWVAQHKEVMEALMVIAKALGVIIIAVLAAGLLVLAVSFAACAAVIVLVIGVVMGLIEVWKLLVVAANWVAGAWHSAINWLVGAWHSLVGFATSTFNAVKNAIVTAFNATITWLVGAWNSLTGFATSAFNAVKNAIVSAFNATIAWIGGAWNSAIGFIVGVWNTLRGAAVAAFNAIRTAIMVAVNAVITWLVGAWNTCVQAIVAAFTWLYNHNYYWKALVDTIRNTVQAVITWLQGAWHNVIAWIVGAWGTLSGFATSAFNAVTSAISGAVNAAVNWLKGAWNSAIAWLGGAWNTIAGLASAAWGAATSVITSIVNAVVSWVQGAWQAAIAWLGGAWNTLAGLASSLWNTISSVISSATSSATSFLQSAWSSASAFLNGVWNTIKAAVVSAWNFIVAQFAAAWGRISGPLNSLGSSIGSFFTGLANQAVSWGSSIVKGIADGITGAIGWVVNAASNVASTISSILGFHASVFTPPKQGPASDADRWGPDLAKGMAQGLLSGQSLLAKASSQVMGPVRANMSGATSGTGGSSASSSRPIIIQVGNREYRAFVDNLGNDLVGSSTVRVHFAGGR